MSANRLAQHFRTLQQLMEQGYIQVSLTNASTSAPQMAS